MDSTVKLDVTDAKIIRTLLTEARTSFTDIAKECNISVSAVRMRYKRLWKEGVINGEVTLINPHSLGYRHIVDLGIITDVKDEAEIARYLESKTKVSQIVTHIGRYNFYAKAILRDLNRLSEIIEDLESNKKIKHVDAIIWAEAINVEHTSNLIIKPLGREKENSSGRPPLTDVEQAKLEIDEIDRKIALLVSLNARTPFRKIAEELGVSTKTVIQRYKRLRDNNLLTLSTITVDLAKLGYKAMADLYIKVLNRSKMTEIYSQLLEIPNLIVIIRLLGNYDLYAAIALEDFNKMFEVSEQISKINGLEKPDVILTPMLIAWPLNLFTELLDNSEMPRFWHPKFVEKNRIDA